jgi:hypothetical protein
MLSAVVDEGDIAIRLAAIQYVHALRDRNEGFVTWGQLTSFEWGGVRVPLIGASGIWKAAAVQAPISITTSPSDPYGDAVGEHGLLRYRYFGAGGDETAHVNAGQRRVPSGELSADSAEDGCRAAGGLRRLTRRAAPSRAGRQGQPAAGSRQRAPMSAAGGRPAGKTFHLVPKTDRRAGPANAPFDQRATRAPRVDPGR